MKNVISYSIGMVFMTVILFCAGCRTVKPPPDMTREWAPPNWERKAQAEDRVWRSVREWEPDTSGPLTLARLIDISLSRNPDTRKSWEAARAAAAVLGQAESKWYPSVTVDGGGNYRRQKFNLKDEKGGSQVSPDSNEFNYGPGLRITYLLLDMGGRAAAEEEALQTLIAANYSFNRAIQDLLLDVATAYYDFYSSRSGVDAAEADVKDAKTALEAAGQKFQVGLVSKLDELQAQSNYEDSLYNQEVARGDLKDAQATLANVIGLSADTEFEIADPAGELPTEISEEDVSNLIEEGMKKRPDIAALRAELKASQAAVEAIDSDLWPTLTLGGGANKYWYSYYGDNEPYDDSYAYTGTVTLGWDIFSGFYDLNRKREAEAKTAETKEELIAAELAASADVWTKYYGFNTAVRKYSFSKAYYDTSQASYNLALESYNTGLKSILDLLQAQSSLSAARNKLIVSKKDVFLALAELAHATGTIGAEEMGKVPGEAKEEE